MWKSVKNYDMYEISDKGQIRRNGKELKHLTNTNKYLSVILCKNGKPTNFRVHRLVAQHFIANPKSKPMVNHLDGNRANCNSDNLDWVTCSENHKHAYKHLHKKPSCSMKGRFGKDHNRSKKFTLVYPDGKMHIFNSGLEMKRKTGMDHSSISYAAKHYSLPYTFKRGSLKGYTLTHWEIVD